MIQPPDARTVLLHGLSAIVRAHARDTETCGREALRLMQVARLTWSDLFGPLIAAEPVYREAEQPADSWPISAGIRARSVFPNLFLATPAELAAAAVEICMGPRPIEELVQVEILAHDYIDRLRADGKARLSTASTFGVDGF